jgi:uncharacterized protein (TIGR02598 family)
MTSMAPILRSSSRSAFSLIEVVMAIAITAFALVAIASTLPVGLQSMRESQNDQAIGTIENSLRGDLQQIPFNSSPSGSIADLSTTKNYYSVEGVQTTITGVDSTVITPYYQATFEVNNGAVNGNAYSGTQTVPLNAATVTVTLTYPYPALTSTNVFSLFATKQVGIQ